MRCLRAQVFLEYICYNAFFIYSFILFAFSLIFFMYNRCRIPLLTLITGQIDPSEKLDPEVEDILVDIAEDFIESVSF